MGRPTRGKAYLRRGLRERFATPIDGYRYPPRGRRAFVALRGCGWIARVVDSASDLDRARLSLLASQVLNDSYADAERRSARAGSIGLMLAVVGAAGIVGVASLAGARGIKGPGQSWVPYTIAASGFLALTLVGAVHGMSQQRTAKDLGRVRRQLRAIETYTADLPGDVAVLLKAVVAPRIFTESGADEPWSSPSWLDAGDVLKALRREEEPPRDGSDGRPVV